MCASIQMYCCVFFPNVFSHEIAHLSSRRKKSLLFTGKIICSITPFPMNCSNDMIFTHTKNKARLTKISLPFAFTSEIPYRIHLPRAYMASNRTRCSSSSNRTFLILSIETGLRITPSRPNLTQFSVIDLSVFPVSATTSGLS